MKVHVPLDGIVSAVALLGGTGKLGRGLALRWAPKERVIIGSRFRGKAEDAAAEVRQTLGGASAGNVRGMLNREAIEEADLVVFCIKLEPALRLAKRRRKSLMGKLILSPVVAMRRKGNLRVPKLKPSTSAALRLANVLGQRSRVVAGLHTIPAAMLYSKEPLGDYSVVVYGEQPAKGVVMQLVREIEGLHPLDGGPLEMSFLSEYTTALLLNLGILNQRRGYSVKYY